MRDVHRHTKLIVILIALLLAIATAAVVRGASLQAHEFSTAVAARADAAAGASHFETCLACHGSDGGGSVDGNVPAIASQHFRVLVKQLVDFRHNARWDIRMEHFVDRHHLKDAQAVADVARYVADLPRDYPVGQGDGNALPRGAAAYRRQCAGCHGALGEGNDRARVPSLAGQHQLYIVRQLQDAADGRRPNMEGRHATLARAMAYEEFLAIADYLSRLTN
jgi:cytochrome c553